VRIDGRGRLAVALLAAGLLGAAVGAFGVAAAGGEADSPQAAAPTAPVVSQPAVSQPAGGALTAEVLGSTCGLLSVRGDHADWLADGRYCRLRLAVTNPQRTTHFWEATAQQVIDADGEAYAADLNATQISDQPASVDVKPGNRVEFDAWFEVPEDAAITAARLTVPVTRAHRDAYGGEVVTTTIPLAPLDAMAQAASGTGAGG